MGEKRKGSGCSKNSIWPVCTSRKEASACCVILDSVTDGVFAVDREQKTV